MLELTLEVAERVAKATLAKAKQPGTVTTASVVDESRSHRAHHARRRSFGDLWDEAFGRSRPGRKGDSMQHTEADEWSARQCHRGAPAACIASAVLALALPLSAVLWHPGALAQTYPAKLVRIIVPIPVGSPPDFMGRVIAQHLTAALGQQVIVDNRPGAGGTIGTAAVAKSPSDGYTLLVGSTTTLSISPSLYANPGYDPSTSFAPISLVATAPFLIVVHPSLPARTLKELIALAKTRPGQLNFGSAGSGTPLHIAGECSRPLPALILFTFHTRVSSTS